MSIYLWFLAFVLAFFFLAGIWWGFECDVASPLLFTACAAIGSLGYVLGLGVKVIKNIINGNFF
ncbi:MAG: hypothetical protein VR65_19895 [Desulfobulbaceae bacterium BRH_c16a]|nr:MAG: hypothetical protein VR65_19895 [Desulfobulbaceae bacterium BRH_c16a]